MKHIMATKPKSHEQVAKETHEWLEAAKKSGQIPLTQKEQRESKRKQRQEEAERMKLGQEDIIASCNTNGFVQVTAADMKKAFPKIIFQIGGNSFRTQIDNKEFERFLRGNSLTFSLPDFIFKKQA